MSRLGLAGSQNPPRGHLLCSKNNSSPFTNAQDVITQEDPNFSHSAPPYSLDRHGSTRSIYRNGQLSQCESHELIDLNWCMTTRIVDQWDLMIREDPVKLNPKEKDALLGLIMKSLSAAQKFYNSSAGK